jgi:23S rRNA (uracil1939-C5)-methyltransferase
MQQTLSNKNKRSRRRRARLPEGEFDITIEDSKPLGLSHEGRGIGKIDDKTHFISYALPNETVSFKYQSDRSKFAEGRAIEIKDNPHPNRVEPKCKVFGTCGGCAMQHLAHKSQIEFKDKLLTQLFEHQKIFPKNKLEPLSANPWGYRHKARVGVKHVPKKGGVLVGFRENDGRFITNMDSCPILAPQIGENLSLLKEFIFSLDAKASIPQIEVAITEDQTALIFRHLEDLSKADQEKLCDLGKNNNWIIYLQPKGPSTIHKIYPISQEHDLLNYKIPDFDLTMNFHPSDFTQVNPQINQKMLNQAVKLLNLNKEDKVLDLFSGIGNFTLPIAKSAKFCVGIEGCEILTQRAAQNAKSNNIDNTEFFTADLFQPEKIIPLIKNKYPDINKICLDPPRDGAFELVKNINILDPETILYVSCNPQTLARDAQILCHEHNYEITHAGIMDMFPHTKHMESMAVFHRK